MIQAPDIILQSYNRHERRNSTFILRNKLNGLFIKRTQTAKKIKYEDVEVEDASRYTFKGVKQVVSEAMIHTNIDIEYRMVYIGSDKQIKTK